ncbi:MAG: PH domain-containing protein [Pseudorhodobacter sp.]|nr:PH domain-containing protein [Frankiaceae bacterium]
MAYPAKLLTVGEEVVLDLHPHWKRLALPVLVLLVVLGLTGFLLAQVSDQVGQLAIVGVAAVLLVLFVVVPFLRWRTTLFVITTRRVVVRTGVLSRQGRDVPLSRINDVTFSHDLVERLLGCGTLVVESAGERGQVTLTEVPRVETVQRTLYDLVERANRE